MNMNIYSNMESQEYKLKFEQIMLDLEYSIQFDILELVREVKRILIQIQNGKIPESSADLFLHDYFPIIVKKLMGRKMRPYRDYYDLRKANDMLIEWLRYRLPSFPMKKIADAKVFLSMFMPSKPFYNKDANVDLSSKFVQDMINEFKSHEILTRKDGNPLWSPDSAEMAFHQHGKQYFILYIFNVYTFGSLGGFEFLKKAIDSGINPEDLGFFYRILKPLSLISPILTREHKETILVPILSQLLKYAEELALKFSEELKINLKYLGNFLNFLKMGLMMTCPKKDLQRFLSLQTNLICKAIQSQDPTRHEWGVNELLLLISLSRIKSPDQTLFDPDEINPRMYIIL